MGAGAKAVECLSLKPCWEGCVPSASIMEWDYEGVLPNCRDDNFGNWEVEELRQERQAVLTKVAEVGHGEPIWPQGDGRARLPYGRCEASFDERPAWGVHNGGGPSWSFWVPDRVGAKQAVNCLLKACAIAFELERVFSSKVIEIFGGGTRPLAT